MAEITIYTTPLCPYCMAAKHLLKKKGAAYSEINVALQPDLRGEMMQRANGSHTVPQIFIGDRHIGGYDDLSELNADGELDGLLGLPAV